MIDDDFDMIVLPGGQPGADHLDADPRIHTLLQRMAEQGAAIPPPFCGGPCPAQRRTVGWPQGHRPIPA